MRVANWLRAMRRVLSGRPAALMSRRRDTRRPLRCEALEDRAVPAMLSHFLTSQHVDINLTRSAGEWGLVLKDDDTHASYLPEDALLYAGLHSMATRPASSKFDFIGVGPGETFYMLPQSLNPNLLYLGFAANGVVPSTVDRYNPNVESKGRVSGNARWLKVSLLDVRHIAADGSPGDGHFSVWQGGTFGDPITFMASHDDGVSNPNASGLDVTDGISGDDAVWVIAGGHAHYNFGFTHTGRYEVTVKLSGFFGDDGLTTPNLAGYSESDPITLYFSVLGVGQLEFDAADYTVDESAGTATVTVRRVGGSDGRLTVDYATADGTAHAGSDYLESFGKLTFEDGQTVQTFVVTILDNSAPDSDRTVLLALSNPGPASIADYISSPSGDNGSLLGPQSSAVLTILDDDGNTPPVANDDNYRAPGNAPVFGNVLFNDTDDDDDLLTASLVTGPARGTLTLNPDGSFVYTPGPTFRGTDSFAYQASDGKDVSNVATVTIGRAGNPRPQAILTQGHVDIGIGFHDEEWDFHIHNEEGDTEYDPFKALLYASAGAAGMARPADPAFNFLGVEASETIYVMPEIENPALPFLGISAEEIHDGEFEGDVITLRLKAVSGPGAFSLWQSGLGGPIVLMASSDGITAADAVTLAVESHAHFNWGFTQRGTYYITFEVVGVRHGGTPSYSGDVTFRFYVGEPPAEIALSSDTVAQTGWSNSSVGTLSADDPDDGEPMRYHLVRGTGDTHNALFAIVGNQLRFRGPVTDPVGTTYSIRVRVTDGGWRSIFRVFTITVGAGDPTDPGLNVSNTTLPQTGWSNSLLGAVATVLPATRYQLVNGDGSTDNGLFRLTGGNQLRFHGPVTDPEGTEYTIRLRAFIADGGFTDRVFTITVGAGDPTDPGPRLDGNSIAFGSPARALVGMLSTSPGSATRYQLVNGDGADDNAKFFIAGDKLRMRNAVTDPEGTMYSIRVRAFDASGAFADEVLTVTVGFPPIV